MRWTRQRRARKDSQGGALASVETRERTTGARTNGARFVVVNASERCTEPEARGGDEFRVRQNRVVLAAVAAVKLCGGERHPTGLMLRRQFVERR